MTMKINILDGHNTIGGNKILITSKDDVSILLDFGKNFASYGSYFEEFLTPRQGAGIYDLWKLGLVPHYSGLYRDALLTYLKDEVDKMPVLNSQALFLTHAHLDHAGYIPFLREDLPIVSSSTTFKMLQSIQDTGGGGLFNEYCNASEREVESSKTGETKLKKKKGASYRRDFRFDKEGEISSFKYRMFPVDHSILGAASFYFEVDGVKIAYTGDLRFHGEKGNLSKEFFNFVKENGADIILCEGTRVPKIEEIEKTLKEDQLTEMDVKNASLDVVKKFKGKVVIADFGARNIERLKIFLDIANETERKLAITLKDAYLLHLLQDEFDYIQSPNLVIIESKREQNREWVKSMLNTYGDKMTTLKNISKDPGNYILCYSFWDMPNLLDLEIRERGAYIYSTSEAYSEEQMIDTRRLFNWLNYLNLEPFGISMNGENIDFTREYHASGHTSLRDLVHEIEFAKPDIVVPLHSEHIETFKEYFGNTIKVCLESEMEL